jgi:hypothetical protein
VKPPSMPTLAELEKAAVHDARAIVPGREECLCRVCLKVEAALAREKSEECPSRTHCNGDPL